ncbi:ferredoxin [Nitriliruptor alkaliphilus]|uniref:ferredoxin n=1 Tax=Nitriliruptor alkaliphilus TaxID=427918 RepID=UPI0006989EB3|nr:ferredoxin [Nitriliruptor alkaliphilus]
MKVQLDLDRCQGYVCCVVAAPEVFDVDDDSGLAVLREAASDPARRVEVERAVRDCPTNAISIAD